jgi:hypothetical protein
VDEGQQGWRVHCVVRKRLVSLFGVLRVDEEETLMVDRLNAQERRQAVQDARHIGLIAFILYPTSGVSMVESVMQVGMMPTISKETAVKLPTRRTLQT